MTSHALIFMDFSKSMEDIPSFTEWECRVNRTDFPDFSKNSFSGRDSNERTLKISGILERFKIEITERKRIYLENKKLSNCSFYHKLPIGLQCLFCRIHRVQWSKAREWCPGTSKVLLFLQTRLLLENTSIVKFIQNSKMFSYKMIYCNFSTEWFFIYKSQCNGFDIIIKIITIYIL